MARGSINNCWSLLEQWSLQFKIIVNRARNASGIFNKSNKIKRADQISATVVWKHNRFEQFLSNHPLWWHYENRSVCYVTNNIVVHVSQLKVLKFILTHTFLVLVTVGLGHGVYRKLYTSIGGQRAEKFENHWFRLSQKQRLGGILSDKNAVPLSKEVWAVVSPTTSPVRSTYPLHTARLELQVMLMNSYSYLLWLSEVVRETTSIFSKQLDEYITEHDVSKQNSQLRRPDRFHRRSQGKKGPRPTPISNKSCRFMV